MNPSVIWELVRPSYFLPALKKGVRIRKSGLRRSAEPPEMGFLEEESSRVFLLGEGEGGGLPGGAERPPPRPPRGFLAVYVGPEMRRFVIPASYLCQPAFRELMEQAAEEFGFQQEGGLQIPCDEATFQELLQRAAALEGTAAAAATAGGKAGRKTKKLAARQ